MSDSPGVRGQTEGIAVILLTAFVILGVGTFGVFYLTSLADQSGSVVADLDVTAVDDGGATTLTVTHAGGESLENGSVVLQSGGATYPLPSDFEEGTQWSTSVPGAPAGTQLRVLVVENTSGSVVFESRVTVQDG